MSFAKLACFQGSGFSFTPYTNDFGDYGLQNLRQSAGSQLLLPFAASIVTGLLGVEAVKQLNEGSALKDWLGEKNRL